jgi:hypothetical protein
MRLPAEPLHPSELILDELNARGWDINTLAREMSGDCSVNYVALEFYLTIGKDNVGLRMGEDVIKDLARIFDISEDYFRNLEKSWVNFNSPNNDNT